MATLEYGTSHPDVKDVQTTLNKLGYKLPIDGAYDEKTAAALEDMCKKLKITGLDPMKVDGKMWEALNYASEPRTKVVVNGKEAWVTKAEFEQLKKLAAEKAQAAVQPLVSMANEAKMLWDAHKSARDANWFWASAVDLASGAKFPAAGVMDAAVKAASGAEKAAKAGTLTPAQFNAYSASIRTAFAAMDQYRGETFAGGEELCKNLKLIQDGCVVVLQVTAAIATGGASWQVQVAVSAGVAAYEATLAEVNKASVDGNYSIETGVVNVFMAAVVDGTVGLILKGGKLGPFMDDVAKGAVEAAGSSMLKKFCINAVNGGAQQMIEDGIKGLPGLADPKKKFTYEDFVKAAVESFVKGAGLKVLGPVCEKYGKNTAKNFSAKDVEKLFKGMGKDIDVAKAFEEGVKKTIDQIGPKIVQETIDAWSPKSDAKKLEEEIRKTILDNNALRRAAQDAADKQKKGKK
jgi:peptidoglycan hydrolase-like protein with peptidoglycan-binding domain